jgi:hypothetical protein
MFKKPHKVTSDGFRKQLRQAARREDHINLRRAISVELDSKIAGIKPRSWRTAHTRLRVIAESR